MVKKLYDKNGIIGYEVSKKYTDEEMKNPNKFFTQKVQRDWIDKVIDHDADVFDVTGKLLIKFRKKVLQKERIDAFYKAIEKFAQTTSSNRGSASGSDNKDVRFNPRIMSNIFGYMDGYSPSQKLSMKKYNLKTPFKVRETRFTQDFPDQYKKTIPLIEDINRLYKNLLPEQFKRQNKKAKETAYRIAKTAFTTVTTNINFQTRIHKDSGDDMEGFGNLVVIEDGKYNGGETCLPQYGIGVDVRMGDMLFMDVHEWHGNLPIELIDEHAKRLSIVCYLRLNVWKWSKGMSNSQMKKHNNTIRQLSKARIKKQSKKN